MNKRRREENSYKFDDLNIELFFIQIETIIGKLDNLTLKINSLEEKIQTIEKKIEPKTYETTYIS